MARLQSHALWVAYVHYFLTDFLLFLPLFFYLMQTVYGLHNVHTGRVAWCAHRQYNFSGTHTYVPIVKICTGVQIHSHVNSHPHVCTRGWETRLEICCDDTHVKMLVGEEGGRLGLIQLIWTGAQQLFAFPRQGFTQRKAAVSISCSQRAHLCSTGRCTQIPPQKRGSA